jgi:hypothetical protein
VWSYWSDHDSAAKRTLARQLLSAESANYFDLEDPVSLSLYRQDEPMTALRPLEGLIVIDEIQRKPVSTGMQKLVG